MRRPRVRLWSMMVAIAFLALALALVVQSIRLRQALAREQEMRAAIEVHRAQSELQVRQARVFLNKMQAALAEQQPQQQPPVAAPAR